MNQLDTIQIKQPSFHNSWTIFKPEKSTLEIFETKGLTDSINALLKMTEYGYELKENHGFNENEILTLRYIFFINGYDSSVSHDPSTVLFKKRDGELSRL